MEEEREEEGKTPRNPGAPVVSPARYEEIMMREAYEALKKERYEDAASIFEEILRKFSSTLSDTEKNIIHAELGTIYFWLGDYGAAKQHGEAALMAGDNDEAYRVLGKIAVAEYQFPKARGYFSKISHDNPARPLGLCLIAIKLRDTGAAESFIREAAKNVSSRDPEFRLCEAYLELLQGASKRAVLVTREVVREFSAKTRRDPALLLLAAEIFMTAGNYGEAAGLSKNVEEVCHENDQVFALQAHTAYADEEYGAAENSARHAIEINPRNAYAKTVLMKLAVRSGTYAVAEELGKQILSDSPEYSLAHANLGDVYFNQGRYELAQIEYEQTQQLMNADTKGAHLRKARMQFISENFPAAAAILEKLIETQHTYYDDAMCDLLLCYDRMNEEEKKETLMAKMEYRRTFFHRTEKLLREFTVK